MVHGCPQSTLAVSDIARLPIQCHMILTIDVGGPLGHYRNFMMRPKVKETIFRLTRRSPHVGHFELELCVSSCVVRATFGD